MYLYVSYSRRKPTLSHLRQVTSRPRIKAETLISIPTLGTGHCSSHEYPRTLIWQSIRWLLQRGQCDNASLEKGRAYHTSPKGERMEQDGHRVSHPSIH